MSAIQLVHAGPPTEPPKYIRNSRIRKMESATGLAALPHPLSIHRGKIAMGIHNIRWTYVLTMKMGLRLPVLSTNTLNGAATRAARNGMAESSPKMNLDAPRFCANSVIGAPEREANQTA